MEETYTFSRALRLMRYGGKKIRCRSWPAEMFAKIENGKFAILYMTDVGDLKRASEQFLEPLEIMGEWVEVK